MLLIKTKISFYSTLLSLFILLPEALANECKREQDAYRKIQQRMNQPYSFSQGEKLRTKERKLFSIFQDCLNHGSKKDKKKMKRKTDKRQLLLKNRNHNKISTPRNLGITRSKRLVIRGKFNGKMQNAWLKYYKTPKECNRPKSTSDFAWCIEHKNKSAKAFEKQWQANRKSD